MKDCDITCQSLFIDKLNTSYTFYRFFFIVTMKRRILLKYLFKIFQIIVEIYSFVCICLYTYETKYLYTLPLFDTLIVNDTKLIEINENFRLFSVSGKSPCACKSQHGDADDNSGIQKFQFRQHASEPIPSAQCKQ